MARVPTWQCILVDVRGHAGSAGLPGPNTLVQCAADLVDVARTTGLYPSALIGHSLGGKIVMKAMQESSIRTALVRHGVGMDASGGGLIASTASTTEARIPAVVLDSLPGTLPQQTDAPDGVSRILHLVKSMPAHALPPTRSALVDTFRAAGLDHTVALWLASNVRHEQPQTPHDASGSAASPLRWAFDVGAVDALYHDHMRTDAWPLLEGGAQDPVDLHLVMATRSARWRHPDAQARLKRVVANSAARMQERTGSVAVAGSPNVPQRSGPVHVHSLEAGHWVHTDNPDGLLEILTPILQQATM